MLQRLLARLFLRERLVDECRGDAQCGKRDECGAPAVVGREQRASERQHDRAGETAQHVEAHGGGAALRWKPRCQQREARREQQRAEHAGDELRDQREPEHVDQSEAQRQRRPAEQPDEEQPLGSEAVGEKARRDLPERVAQRRRGREHACLREADLQILADERQQQRNRTESETVHDLAEHDERNGVDPVAVQGARGSRDVRVCAHG